MEARCSFCEFYGIKPHCNNCKMYPKGDDNTREPHEIQESLEEVIKNIESGKADELYVVGDWMMIDTLVGKLTAYIVGKTHDVLDDGDTPASVTFGILNFPFQARMNLRNLNSGGWKSSYMRSTIMQHIQNFLPPCLLEHIAPVIKRTSDGSENIEETSDKLWLFAESEIMPREYSYDGEGEIYEFFKIPQHRVLFNGYYFTWLRSPSSGSSYTFCSVYSIGSAYGSSAASSFGLSFGFCISVKS